MYNAHLSVARVRDIADAIERIAPTSLSEDWDNCGLQVGRAAAETSRVLVALTPVDEVFEEAEQKGADFLLFHHPLIFHPLRSLDTGSYPGEMVAHAVRKDLAVYAAHTSYDAALEVLSPTGSLRKLVIFVPEENVDAVADALAAEGAGVIGEYTRCTFRTPGTGTFLGSEATDPYLGEKGRLEKVEEIRLETVLPAHAAGRATAAAIAAHPYEQAALDLYPIDGHPQGCGYGRVGRLPEPMSPGELCEHVASALRFPARLVADPEPGRRVERVAVLGGSGGSFVPEVASSGAQAYVTGDLDYHDALLAHSFGLTAIDAGHAATELPSLAPLAKRLAELVEVPVEVSRVRR